MEDAVGEIEIDPEQQAEMQEEMLEFAECMREHGIDMPDPVFGDDGRVEVGIGGPDGEDRAVARTPRRSRTRRRPAAAAMFRAAAGSDDAASDGDGDDAARTADAPLALPHRRRRPRRRWPARRARRRRPTTTPAADAADGRSTTAAELSLAEVDAHGPRPHEELDGHRRPRRRRRRSCSPRPAR